MKIDIDTVNKYKKEFEYLINGGELLVKCFSELAFPQFKRWLIVNKDEILSFTSEFDEVYIINDEYIEYRKAQAENKTIEYRVLWRNGEIAQDWTQTDIIQEMSIGAITEFRVKPEEPKFNVGDWVRDGDRIFQYTKGHMEYDEANPTYGANDKLWEPKQGEICIFWDNISNDDGYLGRFSHMNKDGKYITNKSIDWEVCIPFTGELPPHLKD